MKTLTFLLNEKLEKTKIIDKGLQAQQCQLVLGFGNRALLQHNKVHGLLKNSFPQAHIVTASTSGEIYGEQVFDNSVSVVAMEFNSTTVKVHQINISDYGHSYDAGIALVEDIDFHGLRYIMVLSDGGMVNGSELVRGIKLNLPQEIPVTGGLAGDGASFTTTLVGLNEEPMPGKIVAIAFYGPHLHIGHGSFGGWDVFGLEKTVTRSMSNSLFEIEGKNALEYYKTYLGKYADELPSSALLFPLAVKLPGSKETIVRTILSIDDDARSMIFAGDIPVGSKVRFMRANFDKLTDAATFAANETKLGLIGEAQVAILVSCVGRRLVLNTRTDEELEAVRSALGNNTMLTGFYSYGEISPNGVNTKCELHNQTMTITTLAEYIH